MLKLGVLISGSGTNLQAIIDACANGTLDAEVVLVISSKPDAYGLQRAQQANIPTIGLTREVYNSQLAADQLIAERFAQAGAEYIVMAGYMRMVGAPILEAFPDKVINIHPALLPAFVGAHGIQDAWDYGVKVTGVTVHFANAAYDEGPIIAQRAVEIYEHDSIESLEQRIHAVEHELYPQVLQLLATGRISIDEHRHVRISNPNSAA
ncbi:MAG: phosphoribosylglycinamide formyltransferase [Coriobacteriales bacterium]|jgi:phosphoribosylglycinamide formyltransferase-1|nr:phosphoribosylglycinamide formyltransferase [Coriobacteriales bacterium]